MSKTNGKQNDMIVIHATQDYDIFKGILGNRRANLAHVNSLIVSIGKKNLLRFNPILVNEDMAVIDGQHRLQAAKANGWTIYYRIEAGLTLEDVQLLNANTRSWTLTDYLHSFMAQGLTDYQKLHEFIQTYGISLSLGIHMLLNKTKLQKIEYNLFKSGQFKVANYELAEDMISQLLAMKEFTHGDVWQNREFIRAFFRTQEKISFEKFIERAALAAIKIERRANERDYLQQLENIANFGVRTNHVRFY